MKVPSKRIIPTEQAYESLLACYMAEVRIRHREFIYTEELSNQLLSVSAWLTEPKAKPWLLLCGTCGNGKSTIAKALRQYFHLFPVKDPRDDKEMGLVLTNAKAIAQSCRTDSTAFDYLMKKPMLGIDDLGIEPQEILVFGNVCTPLTDLLTDRYEEQRITIITTNLTPAQIRNHYGDRIADRLNEMAEKIVFRNGSYRCDMNRTQDK